MRDAARSWEQAAARWTDVILCVSESERLEGERAGLRARWRVVPNGVDLNRLVAATEQDRIAARARLGEGEGPLVVCVGRLSKQKGQDVLLDAWARVLQVVPSARLVLVGEGPERPTLERRRVAGVHFAGERADVADWLAAADVVAMPSRWEGMSLVMLETMAVGRSIVATDVAGVKESLPQGYGGIVPTEDASDLAAAVVERLIDPKLRVVEERTVRRLVERNHDLRRTLASVGSVYLEVLEDGPK